MEEIALKEIRITKNEENQRLDKFLLKYMNKATKGFLYKMLRKKRIKLNGGRAEGNEMLQAGDTLQLYLAEETIQSFMEEKTVAQAKRHFGIVYEDDDVLVLNKEAGMVVHPGHGHFSGTLINALAHHLGLSQGPDAEDERMGVLVHRIDKDTSGLLVVAKNDEAQLDLAKQFFVHSIERRYVAIVWGNLKEDEGTITGNIGRDPNDRMRFKVFPDGDYGKHAVTHYRVLERFGYVTVVECRLETGRTHQIRVHFNWIGHPLFNDERYDGSEIRKGTIYAKYRQFIENCFKLLPRQALHAKTLGFVHPRTKQMVRFDSQLPSDMQALIDKWRKYSENMSQFLEE